MLAAKQKFSAAHHNLCIDLLRFSYSTMSTPQQNPAWRRETPRDDSPDGRSEISLDEDTVTPVPAWKKKPKAWLNRTNIITIVIVLALSIFFLAAALYHKKPAEKQGTLVFKLFASLIQLEPEGTPRQTITSISPIFHRS